MPRLPPALRAPRIGVADLREYAEADFVAFTRHRGPACFDQAIHLCAEAGFSPRIRYERLRPLGMSRKSAVLTLLRRKAGNTPLPIGDGAMQRAQAMFESLRDRTSAKLGR